MPKKPTLPPNLPPHAVAECEGNPHMVKWWTAWAQVGDAKDALAAAKRSWSAAEEERRDCRIAFHVKHGRKPEPVECLCGGCAANVQSAVDALTPAKDAVAAAIAALKET